MTDSVTHGPILSSGQRRRFPLVLALVFGLLVSLIHCAGCETAFAGNDSVIVAVDQGGAPSPDAPDQKAPAHCGHCLSHVTAQPLNVVQTPTDISHHTPPIGREQTLTSLAGLPLFKPPRA